LSMVPSWRMRSAGVKGWCTPEGCKDGPSMARLGALSCPMFPISGPMGWLWMGRIGHWIRGVIVFENNRGMEGWGEVDKPAPLSIELELWRVGLLQALGQLQGQAWGAANSVVQWAAPPGTTRHRIASHRVHWSWSMTSISSHLINTTHPSIHPAILNTAATPQHRIPLTHPRKYPLNPTHCQKSEPGIPAAAHGLIRVCKL